MKLAHAVLALAVAVASPASPAPAQSFKAGGIEIVRPWARATADGARSSAVYLQIRNGGTEPDRLVSATSPIAGAIELHTFVNENGVMRMRRLEAIEIGAGASVRLVVGGPHLMLTSLKEPLRHAGPPFPLTLTFEKAGPVTVEAIIWFGGGAGLD